MRSLTCCLLAVVAVPIIALSISDSSRAADGVPPVPSTTSTGGVVYNSCTSINLANCERTDTVGAACRLYYPTQCRNLIQADLDAQAVAAGTAKLHIAGEDSATPGQIVAASSKRVSLNKLRISGLSSSMRTLRYPMALGKYSAALQIPIIEPAISSAMTKASRWASQAGFESCEEFASEIFPDLGAVEDVLATSGTDSQALYEKLKLVLVDNTPVVNKANFGSLSFLRVPVPNDAADTFPQAWWITGSGGFESEANIALESLAHREFSRSRSGEPNHIVRGWKNSESSALWAKNEFFKKPDHTYPTPPVIGATGEFYGDGRCNNEPDVCNRFGIEGQPCSPATDYGCVCGYSASNPCQREKFLPDGYEEPLDGWAMGEIDRQASLGMIDRKEMNLATQLGYYKSANTYFSHEYMEDVLDLQEEYVGLLWQRSLLVQEYNRVLTERSCLWSSTPCPPQSGAGTHEADYQRIKAAANQMLPQFQAIDVKLRDLQIKARKYGCFGESATNVCNISPSLMRQALEQAIRPARNYRESIYKACRDVTQQNFVFDSSFRVVGWYLSPRPDYKFILDKNHASKPAGWTMTSPNYAMNGFWTKDKEAFKTFFRYAVQYRQHIADEQAEIRKLAKITDNGTKRIGEQSSDSGFVGTEILGGATGGGYDYNVSWMVKDYEAGLCHSNVSGNYDFHAYAKVFGLEVANVQFKSDYKTTESTSDVNASIMLGGTELVATHASNSSGYHLIDQPDTHDPNPEWSASQIVVVMGVPVKLSASVDMYASYKIDMTNSFSRTCPTDPAQRFNYPYDTMTMSNRGEIGPVAGLLLTATGEVDAGVASIGVRGRLTLVELGLPMKLENTIEKRASDYQTAFRPKNSVSLKLTTLAGSLTAFVDNPFHDVEVDLLSWGGLSQQHELQKFDTGKNYSLKFACQALQGKCY